MLCILAAGGNGSGRAVGGEVGVPCCSFGLSSVNRSPGPCGGGPSHACYLRYMFGQRHHICSLIPRDSLPRRARPAPPPACPDGARAPDRDRDARCGAPGGWVATRTTHRDRRSPGEWEDHHRARSGRGHHRRSRLGGLRGRATHPRPARLGAPGRCPGGVDDPAARCGARRMVCRRPAAERRLCPGRARWRPDAHQVRRRAAHPPGPRRQRGLRHPRRPHGRRLAARRRRAARRRAADTGQPTKRSS